MKLGICNEMFEDWSIEKTFESVKNAGYEGLEIAPFTLGTSVYEISQDTIEKIRTLSQSTGIQIIGTHWLISKPPGLSVSSADKELRDKTARYLEKLVDLTSQMGGDIMVFGSPKQRNIGEGQTYSEVKKYFIETIMPALEECKKRNVTMCLEPLARTETNFVKNADEAIEIIEEVSHPCFKLHLDVKAMSDEQLPIPEIIKKGAKYLKHFHANDKNLRGPGQGDVDFTPIIRALKDVEYDGWLSVEVFDFSPGPETIARESISYLKKFI
jgi:sugar phosphate isomerase/epimerase